jgi:hypothetical protein
LGDTTSVLKCKTTTKTTTASHHHHHHHHHHQHQKQSDSTMGLVINLLSSFEMEMSAIWSASHPETMNTNANGNIWDSNNATTTTTTITIETKDNHQEHNTVRSAPLTSPHSHVHMLDSVQLK